MKFLDVIVSRSADKFETAWALKETNTGIYIPKCAYAPQKYKRSAIRSLIFRAKHLSSSSSHYDVAFRQICCMFLKNGYHVDYINKIKDEVDSATDLKPDRDVKTIYWRLPYLKEKEQETLKTVSAINRICPQNVRIAVAFRTFKTTAKHFVFKIR